MDDPLALAGLTVLELTTGVPGAYCGRLLAMLGADVVKLESPSRLDDARKAGPFPDDVPHHERSGLHRFLHAQKRSVALDVATPTGGRLLDRLAATADVVLDDGALGRPPAVKDRYDQLLRTSERLIVTAFSPFGLEGPRAHWESTELTELAAGGWLPHGPDGGPPVMPGSECARYGAGTLGALGVLLALAARRRDGRGQLVEVSLNEAFIHFLTTPTAFYSYTGVDMPRMGDSYPYAIYRCADGYVGISILTQAQWAALCQLMDRPDLLTNPRYLTGAERADPAIARELDEIIRTWAATQPAQETFERGQAIRCPVALVPSPTQVLASPQYAARDYWVEYDDPDLGRVRLPGTPFRSVTGGLAPFRPAPALGADTADVVAGLDLDLAARRYLAAAGVLG